MPVPDSRVITTQMALNLANLRLLSWHNNSGERITFSVVERVLHKWKDIGILLGFNYSVLESIEKEKNQVAKECLFKIFDEWTKFSMQQTNDQYSPTWNGLVNLLQDIGDSQLADNLVDILRNVENFTPVHF